MNINQVLIISKLSIANENHNMRNIIWNARGWRTCMLIGIRETNDQGLIFMVAKWVTYIPFVLAFMLIFF